MTNKFSMIASIMTENELENIYDIEANLSNIKERLN